MHNEQRIETTEVIFCYACGSDKSDPLAECDCCKTIPITEDQILASLCSTSALLDPTNLENARRGAKSGITPGFDPESKEILLAALREEGFDMNEMIAEQLSKS